MMLSPRMGHTPAARRLNSRLLGIFTFMPSQWTRRAHSREISRHSSIENTWKRLNWAGPPVHLVRNTGITAWVCGETIPRTTGVGMAAALGSIMNFPMAGRHLVDLLSVPPRERPLRTSMDSAWLAFIPSDVVGTCSALHSTTASLTLRASVTKAYSRLFTAFV